MFLEATHDGLADEGRLGHPAPFGDRGQLAYKDSSSFTVIVLTHQSSLRRIDL